MCQKIMDVALKSLESESLILGRLIYRNKNQHGKTQIFGFLKRVSKTLAFLIPTDRVRQLSEQSEGVLRLKASSRDVTVSLFCFLVSNTNCF